MTTPKRTIVLLLAIGSLLVIGAVVWRLVAVPALVTFPTDTVATLRYEGTMTLFVDPATAGPLPSPTQLPLTIERHIEAVESESDASTVLVDETIVEKAGTLVDTTERNAYVMDRRTMLNVADDRAYDFDPANVVDRSGTYRLNLPFGVTTDATYPIYKNETAATFEMRGDQTRPTGEEAGLLVNNYVASGTEVPLSDAYLAELGTSVPLPRSLTLDELKPQLIQSGVDVDALLAALGPVLTPADLAALSSIAAEAIPLRYVVSFTGTAAIEPTTGAQVHVTSTETILARPDLTTLPALLEILSHYPDLPEAVDAGDALRALPTAPATRLLELRYDQTPASVAETGATISSQRTKVMAVTWNVPGALLGLGLLAILAGGILLRRGRDPEVIDLREAAHRPGPDERPDERGGSAAAEVLGTNGPGAGRGPPTGRSSD